MQTRLLLCTTALLATLVLLALLGAFTTPSNAQVPIARLANGAVASTSSVATTTYATSITPGVPMVMGDTGVILEFAPGASGLVSVTLVPTVPVNPPPAGAIPLNWHITTTATAYEVTATFIYSQATQDADIALVFDESGSMAYDTLCFECWVPEGADGCTDPEGCINPLPWAEHPSSPPATPDHCSTGVTYSSYLGYTRTDEYYRQSSDYYVIIEAEEYSSYSQLADYHAYAYTPYRNFWVVQRDNGAGAEGRDARGGYISHHPFADYLYSSGFGVSCKWDAINDVAGPYCRYGVPGGPFPAPRVDYEFQVPATGSYRIWIRGQGGGSHADDSNHIFWGLDGSVRGQEDDFPLGPREGSAHSGDWLWRQLGEGEGGSWPNTFSLDQGTTYTLNLWAGGAGFDVDRIAITNDTSLPSDIQTAPPNNARTNWACLPCDPRFAGHPGGSKHSGDWWLPDCSLGVDPDQRNDPIYDGEMPIRPAIDAFTRFAGQVDYSRDQIGYVSYDSSATTRSELECAQRLGVENCTVDIDDNGWPDVIENTVIYELKTTQASGATDIAEGILHGINVLGTAPGRYGRPDAAHIMVLMTDGVPNNTPNSYCDDYSDRQWPGGTAAQDCVIYYAHEARDSDIVIYTLSLGNSADTDLMQAVAGLTGGTHYHVPTPDHLDAAFDEILATLASLHAPPPDIEAIYHRDTADGPWSMHPLTLTQASTATWRVTGTNIAELSQWTLGPISPQAPHQVALEADPTALPADGLSTAVLTATIVDVYDNAVQDGTVISFTTSLGAVAPLTTTTAGGVATTVFTACLTPGKATITATVGIRQETTSIQIGEFYYLPLIWREEDG